MHAGSPLWRRMSDPDKPTRNGGGELEGSSCPEAVPVSPCPSTPLSAPSPDRSGTLRAFADHQLGETGSEPDPRFTFANERTFLAWNRTALALIAAGLAAAQFLHFNLHGLRLLIALPLIGLGALLSLRSYGQWVESERAMRLGKPLNYSGMPRALAGGIAVIALLGAVLAVIDRLAH
jgi:putative membrane protein